VQKLLLLLVKAGAFTLLVRGKNIGGTPTKLFHRAGKEHRVGLVS
jgi:hypothetical protein